MRRNGVSFTSVVEPDQLISGSWDPYFYKNRNSANRLDKYIEVSKNFSYKFPLKSFKYSPLEYKDIPRGNFVTYNLSENIDVETLTKYFAVPENTLLFGTMRAYLGNVILTPKSEWLSQKNTWFPINSEFCEIIPFDNLKYYWLVFLKSPMFLSSLPTGTGGTRPRINSEQLYHIPIAVPELEERIKINASIEVLAKKLWTEQKVLNSFITSSF